MFMEVGRPAPTVGIVAVTWLWHVVGINVQDNLSPQRKDWEELCSVVAQLADSVVELEAHVKGVRLATVIGEQRYYIIANCVCVLRVNGLGSGFAVTAALE